MGDGDGWTDGQDGGEGRTVARRLEKMSARTKAGAGEEHEIYNSEMSSCGPRPRPRAGYDVPSRWTRPLHFRPPPRPHCLQSLPGVISDRPRVRRRTPASIARCVLHAASAAAQPATHLAHARGGAVMLCAREGHAHSPRPRSCAARFPWPSHDHFPECFGGTRAFALACLPRASAVLCRGPSVPGLERERRIVAGNSVEATGNHIQIRKASWLVRKLCGPV